MSQRASRRRVLPDLAQNKAYYAVLAVQLSFHFAWHSSFSAAPKSFWFLATLPNFADFGGGGGALLQYRIGQGRISQSQKPVAHPVDLREGRRGRSEVFCDVPSAPPDVGLG